MNNDSSFSIQKYDIPTNENIKEKRKIEAADPNSCKKLKLRAEVNGKRNRDAFDQNLPQDQKIGRIKITNTDNNPQIPQHTFDNTAIILNNDYCVEFISVLFASVILSGIEKLIDDK